MRRHERALAIREDALRQNGDDAAAQSDVAESLLERGRVRARLGQRDAAEADWKRATTLLEVALRASDYWKTRVRYARTLLELGEVDRARPVAEQLLRERSNEPELLELCKLNGIAV